MDYSLRGVFRRIGLFTLSGNEYPQRRDDQHGNSDQDAYQKAILFHTHLRDLISLYRVNYQKARKGGDPLTGQAISETLSIAQH
jgi:hypothetical protein